MFSVDQRDRVREHVLQLAADDARIVAGAEIGALALGGGDRWSDLDLTFGVEDGVALDDVLADWTRDLGDELDAIHLFDLAAGPVIYRVFLLPGCLQVDLSFAPASSFGARGPKFRLLFGSAAEFEPGPPTSARHIFGLGVHHALRARFCIERGRYWQAEHWIAALREHALELACLRRGLEPSYGRDLDELPPDVVNAHAEARVHSAEREELLRALDRAVDGLLRESAEAADLAAEVEPQLRELISS